VIRPVLLALVSLLLMVCAGLDDQPLPADTEGQIYFTSFEIDPRRDYVLGRILNDSPHILTSCRIVIMIYPLNQAIQDSLQLTEVSVGDSVLTNRTPAVSEKMFMRETLKPGYSTEVYFEFPMQDLKGKAVYTLEIIEMKGEKIDLNSKESA